MVLNVPDGTVITRQPRNYAGAAGAWEVETTRSPSQGGYECLAALAYAGGQTRLGALALNKALSLAPSGRQALVKAEIAEAKSPPSRGHSIVPTC
jgi:hypothetical protein